MLEANAIGWGASGRNGGQVNPGLKFDPGDIEAAFGPERGRRMVAFSGAAPQRVFDLIERHQIQCEARRDGTIRAAKSRRYAQAVEVSARAWTKAGAPVQLLDAAAMQAATGTGHYLCGMTDPRGGNVNPLGYARGLARAAGAAGARIHEASPALRTERVPAGWRVTTPGGTVTAKHLLLCTNGYTDGLWRDLRRTVVPVFSMIAATEPLPEPLRSEIMPTRAVLFEVASMTVYYRIDPAGRLLMGGRSPSRDETARPDYQYLIDYTERLWPGTKGLTWSHFWNGQLAISTDHYPHFHEPAPGVLAALAYNGRGVAMATAMGTQLAARVLGTTPEELDMPLTDIRPIPFHGLWRTATAARVAYGRIRDSLGL